VPIAANVNFNFGGLVAKKQRWRPHVNPTPFKVNLSVLIPTMMPQRTCLQNNPNPSNSQNDDAGVSVIIKVNPNDFCIVTSIK
jgi:hypothetical protein